MGGTLRMSNFKTVFIVVPVPQNSYQKWHHNCSTVKFVEQNFYFPILRRNLYERTQNFKILSTPLSFKHKIAEQTDLFYGKICWTKMTKIVILPYFPYNNLSEVKKFHPRINLTTLFSTQPLEHDKSIFRSWNLVLRA
jgi:hypothetical protein